MRKVSLVFGAPIAYVILLAGCGGGGGSVAGSTASSTAIKFGGHMLPTTIQPTADMTLAQTSTLAVGTEVGVSLDRNNPAESYYTGKVMGYDALNNLLWIRLTSDVSTPSGEGDSGSPVFTLPTSFAKTSPSAGLNQHLIGALSYGSLDNVTDFFATPISLMRATGGGTTTVSNSHSVQPTYKGKELRPLSTPIFYSGIPEILIKHMKARASSNSSIQNLVPAPTATSFESKVARTQTTSGTDPYANNSIATFIVHGDVVFSGAVGAVTAADGNGWLAYGHPFNGGGGVEMATCSASVVNMFLSPVYGTYKLANPTNVFDKTMTWDGINAVRIAKTTPSEVTVKTDLVGKTSTKRFTHYVGYDGIFGDQTEYLTSTIESAYLTFFDQDTDLNGSADFFVTTTINGQSLTTEIVIPASYGGVFFGFDPTDFTSESLDEQLFDLMSTVETSGDRKATVYVSAKVVLS